MAQSMMSVSDPEDYVVCTSNKGTRAYTIDTKGIVSITKTYSLSSSEFTNFGLKQLKELNFTDFKVKFVENIFLVNINYQL